MTSRKAAKQLRHCKLIIQKLRAINFLSAKTRQACNKQLNCYVELARIVKLKNSFSTAMAIITVTTVTGNAAVLKALTKVRRVPTHYPMMSLATADLLVGLFVLPIAAARELFAFNLYWAICSCWSTLDVLSCTASIFSLCVLGWERWAGITAPFAKAKRAKRAKIFAVLIWPIAASVAIPTALIPSPKHYVPGEIAKACTVNTNIGYVFFSSSFSFYIPAGVMLTLYGCILRALASTPQIRCHRGGSPCSSPKTVGKYMGGVITRQRRATVTIVLLMSLFLFCWTPFFVMLAADSICECVTDTTWQWCTWLGYANSALNPLVYAASSPSVGRALQASLTSTSSAKTDVPASPNTRKT
ncbi:hypothetical protein K1T71_003015 [Dendrolimus kikuchii]|uniref:Uncharacterized protein n=1 Tax=Dendrolimus kikuchii TaxID=765133 RepID=A0ACC1DAP3_9NEOP|nr:hypothetical protein K1T71_003015 [Dendrolimus kikuchii]